MCEALIVEKHNCPSCDRETNCDVHGQKHFTENHDNHGDFQTYHSHYLLQCRGCDTVFHETKSVFSEDVFQIGEDPGGNPVYHEDANHAYWPNASRRRLPEWIGEIESQEISSAYREVHRSLQVDTRRLTAVGVRLVIDLVFEDLGIDGSLPFKKKLDEFRTLPNVRTEFADELEHMIDVGGAAIHRGWDPSESDIDVLFDGLEAFLQGQYAPRKSVKAIVAPKKMPKKAGKGKST